MQQGPRQRVGLVCDGLVPSHIAKLGKFRNTLSNTWALDWPTINGQVDRNGTFNVYNFSKHELEQISHADIDEDLVIAGISLPFWFPPIPMPNVDDPTKEDPASEIESDRKPALQTGGNVLLSFIYTLLVHDCRR